MNEGWKDNGRKIFLPDGLSSFIKRSLMSLCFVKISLRVSICFSKISLRDLFIDFVVLLLISLISFSFALSSSNWISNKSVLISTYWKLWYPFPLHRTSNSLKSQIFLILLTSHSIEYMFVFDSIESNVHKQNNKEHEKSKEKYKA